MLTFRDAWVGLAVLTTLALMSLPAPARAATVHVSDDGGFSAVASEFNRVARLLPSAGDNTVFAGAAPRARLPAERRGDAPRWMRLQGIWGDAPMPGEISTRPGRDLRTVFRFYGLRFDERFVPVEPAPVKATAEEDPGIDVVPLPAAVWLLGSALGMLLWRARR